MEPQRGADPHGQIMACREHVLSALRTEAEKRPGRDDWEAAERLAVAAAANDWSSANGLGWTVTADQVERVEHLAMGHVDYMSKLALLVAEMIVVGAWLEDAK